MGRKRRKTRKKAAKVSKLGAKKFKFTLTFFWISFFCILITLALFYAAKNIHKIDFFQVKNIESNIPLNISFKTQVQGRSLFDIDTQKMRSMISDQHPEYKEIYIIKRFPSSLRVEIIERSPFAQIQGRNYYLIDKEGFIIDNGSSTPYDNLISIKIADGNKVFKRGQRIRDRGLTHAFDLIKALNSNIKFSDAFDVKLINASLPQAMYMIVDNIKVIVGESNFEKKIKLLYSTMEDTLKSKLSLVKYIDLRHKKIYIGYKR